ncbi:hypothetical protein FOG51_00696 [Hanseniaspora uvarum]|nr:hypothetical protein FOG51_00696 [Hanseniaspora uvarum]KAF0276477.1 hypothetical protein FOG50_02698 [Hanseniaspora uvarum]
MFDQRYTPVELKNTNLFKSIKLNDNVTLQHRAVMAPLTRLRADSNHALRNETDYTSSEEWKEFISKPYNKTGDKVRGLVEEYYHQRSQRPGTLIISEATFISPQAGGYDNAPGIWNDAQTEQLKKIVDAIHENKSYMFVQLWNLGRAAIPALLQRDGLAFLSASDVYNETNDVYDCKSIALKCGNLLRGCTIEEIEQFKKDYVNAARNAFKAGADGVEIHSANGYLLNQFLDLGSNTRTDQYGPQSYENRTRFLFETYDLLAKEFGSDKIGLRLSPYGVFNGMTGPDHLEDTQGLYTYIYQQFESRKKENNGPAYISLMEPRVGDLTKNEGEGVIEGVTNDFIFENFSGVVLRAGDLILGNDFTKEIIEQNDRTLVAYGRYFIANPDLVDRLEKELPVNKYNRDTFYTPDFKGYTDYPYYHQE